MHTAKEARALWCPFTRTVMRMWDDEPRLVAVNRPHDDGSGTNRCVANECMAWRWHRMNRADDENFAKGYCGLAGRPE